MLSYPLTIMMAIVACLYGFGAIVVFFHNRFRGLSNTYVEFSYTAYAVIKTLLYAMTTYSIASEAAIDPTAFIVFHIAFDVSIVIIYIPIFLIGKEIARINKAPYSTSTAAFLIIFTLICQVFIIMYDILSLNYLRTASTVSYLSVPALLFVSILALVWFELSAQNIEDERLKIPQRQLKVFLACGFLILVRGIVAGLNNEFTQHTTYLGSNIVHIALLLALQVTPDLALFFTVSRYGRDINFTLLHRDGMATHMRSKRRQTIV